MKWLFCFPKSEKRKQLQNRLNKCQVNFSMKMKRKIKQSTQRLEKKYLLTPIYHVILFFSFRLGIYCNLVNGTGIFKWMAYEKHGFRIWMNGPEKKMIHLIEFMFFQLFMFQTNVANFWGIKTLLQTPNVSTTKKKLCVPPHPLYLTI